MSKRLDPQLYESIPKFGDEKEKISELVAVSKDKDDVEDNPFLLSFTHYNEKACEIDSLKGNCAKKALYDLRTIGRSNYKTLHDNGIKGESVTNDGDYKDLFYKIPEDVDIREHKLHSTARLFYFFVKNVFSVVAITNAHRETKKNRR